MTVSLAPSNTSITLSRPWVLLLLFLVSKCSAFIPSWSSTVPTSRSISTAVKAETNTNSVEEKDLWSGLQADLQMRWRIYQDSSQYSFNQKLANVLAGDYDEDTVQAEIDSIVEMAPCVMFEWGRSPSCVKAKEAFETMGILDQIRVVPLDDPWDKGNPLRAQIGKQVGRSSVPMIFIGGKYVGGFDGGVSDEAPGIQTMAFQGKLRPALEAAGVEFAS